MPRKIRQLKADLRKAGFVRRPGRGKGSHEVWQHPGVREVSITLAGRDSDDAQAYQEQQIRDAIEQARAALDAGS